MQFAREIRFAKYRKNSPFNGRGSEYIRKKGMKRKNYLLAGMYCVAYSILQTVI